MTEFLGSAFSIFAKMSLQGVIIILIVLLVRLILKKMHVSHKYLAGMWLIVFFYLCFPWKLSLPIGFWGNEQVIDMDTVLQPENMDRSGREAMRGEAVNKGGIDTDVSKAEETGNHISNPVLSDIERTGIEAGTDSHEPERQTSIQTDKTLRTVSDMRVQMLLPYIWITGVLVLLIRLVYSGFRIRSKLLVSIPEQEDVRWTEGIAAPFVLGFFRPVIYLPAAIRGSDLTCIIAHERMHIRRKDMQIKLIAYVICLFHWYNPLVWAAYCCMGSDMEKACDEGVIRLLGEEKKKDYANALLQIGAGAYRKHSRVFVAPIGFDAGNVKRRIKNILQYQHTLPRIGAVVVLLCLILTGVFMTKTEGEKEQKKETQERVSESVDAKLPPEEEMTGKSLEKAEELNSETKNLPVFYAADADALKISDPFDLADHHITSRYTASNYFFIDEAGTLWGNGRNEYGQLGTGTCGIEEYYREPVKIAEHVISVDASWNDYFCIYLTEEGQLYGMGLNYSGLLLGEGSEQGAYSASSFQKVTTPVLLMEQVIYARAGRESIAVIKEDKTAYWWGQFAPTTRTHAGGSTEDFWSVEETENNPAKMLAVTPRLIMENCRYITTGAFMGAAINEAGDLYTWGSNVFGQCGTPITADDFVRTPEKILEHVKMVWVEKIYPNGAAPKLSDYLKRDLDYTYNLFVLTEADEFLAAGWNIGEKEKVTELTGDLVKKNSHVYSDTLIPAQVIEYPEEEIRKQLDSLSFGMTREETESVLHRGSLEYYSIETEDEFYIWVEDGRYGCFFDEKGTMISLLIEEGASRDNRFKIGQSLESLKEAVKDAGGELERIQDEEAELYRFVDTKTEMVYEFQIYEDEVSVLWEKAS